MGRAPCCDKTTVKRGPWSPEEDAKLKEYIEKYGTGGNWIALPQKAGLKRCGKSCRLRWLNYLRPNIKHGDFSEEEDRIICNLYASIGSRWSIIAAQLPGRTDNDIKNYWNTKLKKKFVAMGMSMLTSQRKFSYSNHASFSSLFQTSSSPSQLSPSSSYSLYNCSNSNYTSPQAAGSFKGLEQFSISTSPLSTSTAANTFLHPEESLHSPMQNYQVKESMHVVGNEASCSSSDGSTNNITQISQVKALDHEYGNDSTTDDFQHYICNNGLESISSVGKSTRSWEDNYPLDYSLEDIKQLISTSSCNNSLLFDDNNNIEEKVMQY